MHGLMWNIRQFIVNLLNFIYCKLLFNALFVCVSACDGGDLFSNEIHIVADREKYPSCGP